jgi:2,4-dienoyl-CoA reductase-like NADH-dependent reductase (Old Yellow Enzyme family)
MYPIGQVQPWQIGISDDSFIPGLARVVEAVHRHGAKYAVQLHQGGLVAGDDTKAGRPQWCPSVPEPMKGDFTEGFLLEELQAFASAGMPTYKVLTHEDIQTVSSLRGRRAPREARRAAMRSRSTAGTATCCLRSCRRRPTSAPTSTAAARRTARVSWSRCARGAREVGPDLAVIVKLDSREVGKEGGITLEHAKVTAKLVEEAGADAITVTAYHNTGIGKLHSASNIPHEPNTNLPAAAAIKEVVKHPDHHFGACRARARRRRDSAPAGSTSSAWAASCSPTPDCRTSSARAGKAEQVRPASTATPASARSTRWSPRAVP